MACQALLSKFTSDCIELEGLVEIEVELSSRPIILRTTMEFMVMMLQCVHNAILSQLEIAKVAFMTHLCMKFHTSTGIGVW